MRVFFYAALVAFLSAVCTSDADAQAVDLRGKKGIVDPSDLKKYDPPSRSLKTKEPPSPKVKDNRGDFPPKMPGGGGGDESGGSAPGLPGRGYVPPQRRIGR